jgi:putative redox protein
MNAHIKLVDGLTFVGKGSTNHWVTMDTAQNVGGADAASRPMELVLISLGGCTGMDVISILKKKRVPFENIEIRLDAKRAEEHPRIFTKIRIEYVVYGKNIKENDVERAIELSQKKYCSVSAMLQASTEIETQYTIKEIS